MINNGNTHSKKECNSRRNSIMTTRSTNLPFSQLIYKNDKIYKICSKCKQEKEITEFSPELRRANKTQAQCRECVNKYHYTVRTKEYVRNSNLKALYRITIDDYNKLYES